MPDYYNVLRLGHNASRKDIEKAHERLLKEADYDSTIDKSEVERAYRILTDIATKAQYDARHTLKTKKIVKSKPKSKFNLDSILEWFTLTRLILILMVCLMIAGVFYWFRFGYKLETFQAGDVIFDRATKTKYGKIVKVESDHFFGDRRIDAYQIQLDKSILIIEATDRLIWIPQDTVKERCYKP